VLLVTGVPALLLSAQAPQQQPTFRARTDLVQVDVVAVDAEGRHVRGLTREDFEVYDRKTLQTVAAFEEVTHAREAPPPDALPPSIRSDVATNQVVRAERLVVLVIDDLHIYKNRTDRARAIARDVVTTLGADASMAVLFTSGDDSTEVTGNRWRILSAVDAFRGRKGWPRPHQAIDMQRAPGIDPEASLDTIMAGLYKAGNTSTQEFFDNMAQFKTLQDAARLLDTGEARRKAFVMLSEGINRDVSGIFDGEPHDAGYHDIALRQMMASLRRSNVTVYNLDPRGRVSSQDLQRESFPAPPGMLATQTSTPNDEDSMFRWFNPIRRSQDGLTLMAEAAGGFAVTDTDDFAAGVARVLEDLDHYYLIGFYPSQTEGRGFRPLDVRVRREGLTLRFRRGYEAGGPVSAPKSSGELAGLASGILPDATVPMRLHALPMPLSERETRVHVAIELTMPRRDLQQPDQRLLDELRYGLFAVDLKGGKVREQFGRGARMALRPRAGATALPDQLTYVITSSLDLPPGRYQLRASASSGTLRAGGSVFLDVDVPRFQRTSPALTDLLIGYADGPRVPVARDRSVDRTTLPFAPALDRVFRPGDTLRVYFRAVPTPSTALGATIAATAVDGTELLSLDRQFAADGSIDIRLPLAQLGPGAYRLEARVGYGPQAIVKSVGFAIR
jgi:VWFA-related protein